MAVCDIARRQHQCALHPSARFRSIRKISDDRKLLRRMQSDQPHIRKPLPTSRLCRPRLCGSVIIPRGSAGFGQEYAAHHVNTAGEGVADDIIEAVKAFTDSHSRVDSKKIGCIGASYGGFMTQYLQTKTDIFAAGISHAGISDHTSYWGEGYWGYSYSEVCMANSCPWTRKDLVRGPQPALQCRQDPHSTAVSPRRF